MLPGIVGTLQANEALKLIIGYGDPLAGRLLTFDAHSTRFAEVKVRRDPSCPACGGDSEQGEGAPPRSEEDGASAAKPSAA
ncbi:hypothetical protein BH18ACT15_BH18ACT15_12250 [soil metagenome]